jgi:hypothetical protein
MNSSWSTGMSASWARTFPCGALRASRWGAGVDRFVDQGCGINCRVTWQFKKIYPWGMPVAKARSIISGLLFLGVVCGH